MTDTPHLALPLLAAAQAQKHVTHNEALAALDALVHLAVKERRTEAPGAPASGDRYLVAAGAAGVFAGREGQIAWFDEGAWRFLAARPGWRCFVEAEDAILVRAGEAWQGIGAFLRELSNLDRLGIGTAPDAVNRLAAKLNAALFTARGREEDGTGDLRFVLNKEEPASTLSQLYQTGYSGRAETGLVGDDDFRIRVSPDGSTWHDAMRVDAATGAVVFPAGAHGSGGFGNLLLNADFSVNQRVFAGGWLAQGEYGFDRWKGGPGGCSVTRASDGTVTLEGSIVQVIERPGLAGATVTVSVEDPTEALQVSVAGATGIVAAGAGRRGVTLAVPAEASADVPVMIASARGSFARPVLNRGAWQEPFVHLPAGLALLLCQRYYAKTFPPGTAPAGSKGMAGSLLNHAIVPNTIPHLRWQFPVPMRATPVLTFFNPSAPNGQWSVGGVNAAVLPGTATPDCVRIGATSIPAIAAGIATAIHAVAVAEL